MRVASCRKRPPQASDQVPGFGKLTTLCQKFVKTYQTVGTRPTLYKAKTCQTVRTAYNHMSEGDEPPQNSGGGRKICKYGAVLTRLHQWCGGQLVGVLQFVGAA